MTEEKPKTDDDSISWTEHELKVIEEAKRRSRRFVCVGQNHLGGGSWVERQLSQFERDRHE